jgi:peptidoglycan hydrolase CwlO-like protein
MGLENTELKIGNTSFKGIWIAIVLTIGTSIGGTVWTASSLYSRLELVEGRKIPNITPLTEQVTLISTQLKDNDVPQLQGKLAELGVNLKTIVDQQAKLLEIKDEVKELKEQIIKMQTTVDKAERAAANLGKYDLDKLEREIQDLWDGMDYLSNPLN